MNAIEPKITIEDIEQWVGPVSFKRGEGYFFHNAIFETQRQGSMLKAKCHGSSASAYRVQVILDKENTIRAHCSCPVGSGGYCKHVAALLLTWIEKPGAFEDEDNLDLNLVQRSKEELIAIIRQMLQQQPELAYLLEVPSPLPGSTAQSIDPELIRRQVKQVFSSSGMDWGWRNPSDISTDLEGLLDLADQYLVANNNTNAAIIYQIVSEEVMSHEEIIMRDDEGCLHWLVSDCVEALAELLEEIQTPGDRLKILQSLLHIYLADQEMGGLFIADHVPIIFDDETTVAEKEQLAKSIRDILPSLEGWASRTMGGLLLDLQGESLLPEDYLDICRKTDRTEDLVDKLLALDRVDEAVKETKDASDYTLLSLASSFVEYGHATIGERLIIERTKTSRDSRLWEWLRDHAFDKDNLPEALNIASQLFWEQPSLEDFLAIKQIAIQNDQWSNLRPEILSKLDEQKQFDLLAKIHLIIEEDIDLALAAVEKMRANNQMRSAYDDSIEMRIARAAEQSHPQEAIYLYLEQAERLIALRGRKKYRHAVDYLKKVHQLFQQNEALDTWQKCITFFRQEYHHLPALQDEINKAEF